MDTNTVLGIIINEMQERAEKLKAEREAQERGCCIQCGAPIVDYEAPVITGNQLTINYHCSCGCNAAQYFTITYIETKEITNNG